MLTVLGILGTVGLAVSGALFSFGHKSASVWILFGSLVIYSFSLCYYLQSLVSKEHRLAKPRFSEKIETFEFSLGERGISVGYSVEALRKQPAYPYNFNDFKPVKLYVDEGVLYADVTVFGGSGIPPIKIEHHELSGKPSDWDFNSNEKALEIVNENQIPIYQFYYKTPSHIVVNGLFPFPGGFIVAGPDGAVLNPTVPVQFRLRPIFKYPSWKHPGEYAGVNEAR